MPRTPRSASRVRPSNVTQLSDARLASKRATVPAKPQPNPAATDASARSSTVVQGLFAKGLKEASTDPSGPQERAEYETLLKGLRDSFRPAGAEQHRIVNLMADGWWRLNRLSAVREGLRAQMLQRGIYDALDLVKSEAPFSIEEERISDQNSRLMRQLYAIQNGRKVPSGAAAKPETAADA